MPTPNSKKATARKPNAMYEAISRLALSSPTPGTTKNRNVSAGKSRVGTAKVGKRASSSVSNFACRRASLTTLLA